MMCYGEEKKKKKQVQNIIQKHILIVKMPEMQSFVPIENILNPSKWP